VKSLIKYFLANRRWCELVVAVAQLVSFPPAVGVITIPLFFLPTVRDNTIPFLSDKGLFAYYISGAVITPTTRKTGGST
jgi:hypothetical protein